ncbi:hypothetical protein F4604DRAFT_1532737, partial [Suillus subluteus]
VLTGDSCFPGLIVCLQFLFVPWSPHWLISKGRYEDAFTELYRLQFLFAPWSPRWVAMRMLSLSFIGFISHMSRLLVITILRNGHAAIASWIVI